MIGLYIIVFALAFASDTITLLWHQAREHERITPTVVLSMVLESLTWIPVLLLVYLEDWRIAVLSVLASGLGTFAGMVRITRQNGNPVIGTAAHTATGAPSFEYSLGQEAPPAQGGFVPGFVRRIEYPEPGPTTPSDTHPVIPGVDTQE